MASFTGLGSSSPLTCVYVRLVPVSTIWTSVCSWITHDRYKIKAINVSLTRSFAIYGSDFNYVLFTYPSIFLLSFSTNPKSISFSGKTPVRHQNEAGGAGRPIRIQQIDPRADPRPLFTSKLPIWRQKWVTGVASGIARASQCSQGRIIVVLFQTIYAVPRQIKPGFLKLTIRRGQSNFSIAFIFVSFEEKGYYGVSVGQLSFDCR